MLRLIADRGQCVRQGDIFRVVQIDERMAVGEHLVAHQLAQFALRQNRRVQDDLSGVLRADVEEAALTTDIRLQRHDDSLAQRIDRRIGNLRKLLAKIVEQGADLGREHRHRRVVAHRSDRFQFGLGQHAHNFVPFLGRQIEHLLITGQCLWIHRLRGRVHINQFRVEVSNALLEPFLVRRTSLQHIVNTVVIEQLICFKVDGQHFPGPETAFCDDVLWIVIVDTDLRRNSDMAVLGYDVASRAQTVAVETADGVMAIGQHNSGRPVPGLDLAIEELVECPHVRIERVHGLPGRWNQDAHRLQYVHAGGAHELEHVVETGRVGTRQ